jgi:WS/DGAT/MGAT family acyltransferase
MMHVAGLMQLTPPPDAPPDFLPKLVAELRATPEVVAPWNLRLSSPRFLRNPLQSWVREPHPDLDYHLRRSALASPGDERELGVLVSRLHSNSIDFFRPPWELHVIEGLEGGRFAVYVKVHHSLVDGISSMRILARTLSTTPDDRDKPLFFAVPAPPRAPSEEDAGADFSTLLGSIRHELGSLGRIGNAVRGLADAARGRVPDLVSPLRAPRSILNARVGRNRRFATQQYDLERLKELSRAVGGTLNDVVIALCAGGLRRFLIELGELPEQPLVAFLPVNLRPKADAGGGNSVGAILATMATDRADPLERIEAIVASTRRAKEQLEGMTPTSMLAYSAFLMSPFGLQAAQAWMGVRGPLPVNFNVCISNVPGPTQPLYLRGAKLDAIYPVSIPTHGMALNITCQSYMGSLGLGFIGCRDALPHLQNLAVFTGDALTELEAAVAARRASH